MSKNIWKGFALLWTLFILYLLTKPAGEGTPWWYLFPHIDKLLHAGLFSIWSIAISMVYLSRDNSKSPVITISGLCLAIATELIQAFLPDRSASILDIVADLVGVIIGIVVTFYVKKKQ